MHLENKSRLKKAENIQQRLFVLGAVNSGKSSLINTLSSHCAFNNKNVFYRDPFDKDYSKMLRKIREQKFLDEEEKTALTTSYVPGTTLGLTRVGVSGLGFAVFDTPGVLNTSQPFNFISNMETLKFLQRKEAVSPAEINGVMGDSVWFGGLVKLDILSVD